MAGNVAFTLVAEDLADMQRTLVRRGLRQRRFVVRMVGLLAIALVLATAGLTAIGETPYSVLVTVAAGIAWGLLVLFGIIVSVYALVPHRAARTFAQQRSLNGTIRFAWEAGGFALDTSYGLTRYQWADMTAWTIGKRCILIMASDAIGHLVPLRALTAEQRRDLEATLVASGLSRR